MTKQIKDSQRIREIVNYLTDGCHILSKNYHDGAGRRWWLRDVEQNDIWELTHDQIEAVKKLVKLSSSKCISSDEAYWMEIV
jgi:hypothetical protein